MGCSGIGCRNFRRVVSCFDGSSWACLRCNPSIAEPFIHIPQIWHRIPWELIWIFLKGLQEGALQGFKHGTHRKMPSDASSPSISTKYLQWLQKHLSLWKSLHFPPLSSPAFCSTLSVLFSVNPATLFYRFPKYPPLTQLPDLHGNIQAKGCRLVGKRVWILPHSFFCPYHTDMWALWDCIDQMILFYAPSTF